MVAHDQFKQTYKRTHSGHFKQRTFRHVLTCYHLYGKMTRSISERDRVGQKGNEMHRQKQAIALARQSAVSSGSSERAWWQTQHVMGRASWEGKELRVVPKAAWHWMRAALSVLSSIFHLDRQEPCAFPQLDETSSERQKFTGAASIVMRFSPKML